MVIDKNVPIPEARTGRQKVEIYDSFEIGDSVWVPTQKDANRVVRALHYRKQKAIQRAEGVGIRVWRSA